MASSVGAYLLDHEVQMSAREIRDPAAVINRAIAYIRMAPDEVFSDGSRWKVRSLAFEMRDLRNELAHFGVFDREARLRFFGTAWRLLDGLGLAAAVEARSMLDDELTLAGVPVQSESDEQATRLVAIKPWLEEDDSDGANGVEAQADLLLKDILDEVPMRVDTLMHSMYGIQLAVRGQMAEALWVYQGISDVPCPDCGTLFDVCRAGAYAGPPDHRAWAVVCTECVVARRKQVLADAVRHDLYRWGVQHPRYSPGNESA